MSVVQLRDSHSWFRAICFSVAISTCIAVDILQYSFPLSFLPRSLEDEGHSSRHIAAVIGGYYWSGFAGGVVITSYQIYRILFCRASQLTLRHVMIQLAALIAGLAIGALTLVKQASDDTYSVHMACRLVQGFLGAILFFYSYLLSIELFRGKQQLFALTLNTIALNVAEVGGPLLGATVFTLSGQETSFYFLTLLSVLNQIGLLGILYWVWTIREKSHFEESSIAALLSEDEDMVVIHMHSIKQYSGLERFIDVIADPHLWKALAVIAPAALIKAELENILPLYADHHLGYDTMSIGLSFSSVAVAFVISSIAIGLSWDFLLVRTRDLIVGSSMVCLSVFSTTILPVTQLTQNPTIFMSALAVYGIFLGLTITPSSFMLGEFVDRLRDSQSKDVANGIWNTLWEMGGAMGFMISGIPLSNDWKSEEAIISSSSITLVVAAGAFFFITGVIRRDHEGIGKIPNLDDGSPIIHARI